MPNTNERTPCPICNRTFRTRESLEAHIAGFHRILPYVAHEWAQREPKEATK